MFDQYLSPEMYAAMPPSYERVGDVVIRHDNGKAWRLESADGHWGDMRPIGLVTAEEARRLCRRIAIALKHCDEDGVPLPSVERAFVWTVFIGGMLAGGMLAGIGTIAWKTATTFLGVMP